MAASRRLHFLDNLVLLATGLKRSAEARRAICVLQRAADYGHARTVMVTEQSWPRKHQVGIHADQGTRSRSEIGGQGQDRTADLPLFRSTDHRLGGATAIVWRGQRHPVTFDRLPCTGINETTNETTPQRAALPVSHQRRGDLPPGPEAGEVERVAEAICLR